jgi:hypothetical protein
MQRVLMNLAIDYPNEGEALRQALEERSRPPLDMTNSPESRTTPNCSAE